MSLSLLQSSIASIDSLFQGVAVEVRELFAHISTAHTARISAVPCPKQNSRLCWYSRRNGQTSVSGGYYISLEWALLYGRNSEHGDVPACGCPDARAYNFLRFRVVQKLRHNRLKVSDVQWSLQCYQTAESPYWRSGWTNRTRLSFRLPTRGIKPRRDILEI